MAAGRSRAIVHPHSHLGPGSLMPAAIGDKGEERGACP